jgi:hypothetical protein
VTFKPVLPFLAIVAIGCGSGPSTDLLCGRCKTDADCGGNPCFVDVTGSHFCGAPCDVGCPSAFSCQPVQSTSMGVVKTCFPTSLACAGLGHGGGGGGGTGVGGGGADMSAGGGGSGGSGGGAGGGGGGDMAFIPCTTPTGGTVTTAGGTVDRLYFGYTGDTRMCTGCSGTHYDPTLQMVINKIYSSMKTQGIEFALDGGDHMEASNGTDAAGNMQDYLKATALLGKPVFMTMGNHECSNSYNQGSDCTTDSAPWSDYRLHAYMNALKTEANQDLPYYRVDIMTQSGKAVFLVVADDTWNATQQAWLTQQLTDADAHAKYTFVTKHHPDGNTNQTWFQDIYNLVKAHKYTLFLTGHSHEYKRQYGDQRAVVMGMGGAPHDNPNQQWWGYLTVMQCPNDDINVAVYDQSTGNVMDQFSVHPQ